MRKSNLGIIDDKAFDILVKYRNISIKDIPQEEFSYALDKGYLFEETNITHNEAVKWLFREYELINKIYVSNSFLASLSTNQISWRIGLAVYSIMQTFPFHLYQKTDNIENISKTSPCCICSSYINHNSFNYMNLMRIAVGKFLSHSVYNYAFCLQEQNKLSIAIKPNKEDFELFIKLIKFLCSNKEIKGPTDLLKRLRKNKILNLNNESQLRAIIDLLGYCCILESKTHLGPLTKYVNLATAPRKTHSSDWSYPVDFWTGEDGINREAYNFWFGDYPELNIDEIV
jgi:hypothetical protein